MPVAFFAYSGAAHASAFYLQEQSVKGAGRAFSGEVADQGPESLWWNPAAIAGQEGCAGALGASGSEFAVIPPDNATGNFTKIVRRFTVRILLDQRQAGLDRLATGMSVTPRIEIGSHVDGRSHGGLMSWLAGGSFRCGTRS